MALQNVLRTMNYCSYFNSGFLHFYEWSIHEIYDLDIKMIQIVYILTKQTISPFHIFHLSTAFI